MQIRTTRFGTVDVDSDAVIEFPGGLLGFQGCQRWMLLADSASRAVAWLQSVDRADLALAVVSPRRFIPEYQIRVARRELEAIGLDDVSRAEVLAIVGKSDRAMTLNLKAPLVINVERGMGRQVIGNGELPIQFEIPCKQTALRQSA